MPAPTRESDYYLIANPPARSQFRTARRSHYSGVQVIHSAENTPDLVLPDTGAERTARFISSRTTPGSYHSLSDSDSLLWMIPLRMEAFHDGTGSNPWSVGHSIATQASKWMIIPQWWKDGAVTNMALAAACTSEWAKSNGLPVTPAKRISRAETERRVPGFISHGERDPGRRSDPGKDFPWGFFLRSYAFFCQMAGIDVGSGPVIPTVLQRDLKLVSPYMRGEDVRFAQQFLGLLADGIFGRKTDDGVRAWQKVNGLREDGIIGGDTWTAMQAKAGIVAPVVPPAPASPPNPQESSVSSNHESIVRQNYKVFTAREGDVGGVAHWSAVLASGASEDSISLAMLRSEGMGKIWKSLASLDTANDALRAENAALRAQVSNLKPADLSDLKASIAGLSARIDSDRGDSVDYGRIERDVIAAIVHALSR